MACALGFTPTQCAEDHWARALRAHREGANWRARCPLCGRDRVLEITPKTSRVWWNCHGRPECDHVQLRALFDGLVPCRSESGVARKQRERAAAEDEMRELILDRTVTDNALRLGLLQVLDRLPAADAARKLGMARSTYYDALRILGKRDPGRHRIPRR